MGSYRIVELTLAVPLYLGDDKWGFDPLSRDQRQKVDLTVYYFPETKNVEITTGMNLYTRYSMSQGWLRALERSYDWKKAISDLAETQTS